MSRRKKAYRAKPCVCGSETIYRECCGPYHEGEPAPDATALMRSRYSAYALGLSDYIISTTLLGGEAWRADEASWRSSLKDFARDYYFGGVEIIDTNNEMTRASVTFRAVLRQRGKDHSFTERSEFQRAGDRWRYVRGDVEEAPVLEREHACCGGPSCIHRSNT
ncbi:MAG: YchJ family metal-binding protein [Myxococcota bacterium]